MSASPDNHYHCPTFNERTKSLLVIYCLCDRSALTQSCLLLQAVTPLSHSWKEARYIYYPTLPTPDPRLAFLANEGNSTEDRRGYETTGHEGTGQDSWILNIDPHSAPCCPVLQTCVLYIKYIYKTAIIHVPFPQNKIMEDSKKKHNKTLLDKKTVFLLMHVSNFGE